MRSLTTLAALATLASAKTYTLHTTSQGDSFFDAWTFPGGWNTTTNTPTYDASNSGDNWLSNKTYAESNDIVSINDKKNAVLRVSGAEVLYNDKRYSFRIESSEMFGIGSLFVLDAVHIPYGCSVWPAYWMSGQDWPEGGEIDVLENVNLASNNQMALHTHGGGGECKVVQSTEMTGTVSIENCGDSLEGNTGCIIRDPSDKSFSQFNANQGGMWVTEFSAEAINIWFFSRADIPEALTTEKASQSVDPATFGTPTAKFSGSTCDISNLFTKQKIIINTTLCGVFAAAVYNDTCPATRANNCYLDQVMGNGSNYAEAYFEIVSHRVFLDGSDGAQPDPAGTTSSGGSGPTGTGGGSIGLNGLPTGMPVDSAVALLSSVSLSALVVSLVIAALN